MKKTLAFVLVVLAAGFVSAQTLEIKDSNYRIQGRIDGRINGTPRRSQLFAILYLYAL